MNDKQTQDQDKTSDGTVSKEIPQIKEYAVTIIKEYRYIIASLVIAGLLLASSQGYTPIPRVPDAPPWVGDYAAGYIIIGIPCFIVGIKIVQWLRRFRWEAVAEVDAARGFKVTPYRVPPQLWKDKVVDSGKPFMNEHGVWIVRRFDWDASDETLHVTGAWPGEKNDVELMTREKEIRKNRGQLKHWAQIGQTLYSSITGITQAVESAYWRMMSDRTLDEVAMDSDVVRSEVTEDVEQLVDSIELPGEDADEPDAEAMMEDMVNDAVDGDIPDNWGDQG